MAILQIYQDSKRPGRCSSCHARITWAELVKSGKRMPFSGDIFAVRTSGSLLSDRIVEDVDTAITPSHFEDCPFADQHRRRA